MSILITGATGFLGQQLVHELLNTQRNLVLLVRPKSIDKAKSLFSNYKNISYLPGDISKDVVIADSEAFLKFQKKITKLLK